MIASTKSHQHLALIFALAVMLAGCGGSDEEHSGHGGGVPTSTSSPLPTQTSASTATRTFTVVPATATSTSPPPPASTSTATATRPAATVTSTSTATLAPPSATATVPPATATATITNTPAATATASSSFTSTPTVTATPTTPPQGFAVHSSVEQLLIDYAQPGLMLQVEDSQGQVLQTGMADAQGTLIFRDLTPGSGYVVSTGEGSDREQIGPVDVWSRDQAPDISFYKQQHVVAGYQYIEMRDGTLLAINVILPGPIDQGPYPTVIEYSGYDPSNPDSPQPSTLLASTLGYAAVGINIRGTGCSGGSFKFFETAE
ncbi:MAG TPA: CocE/NonD family hydrolase, partial [Candidatus Acidoferrales bacterium]|nr:CocE/NonD family hydrolase [Candidatus Acidoferrales bacterium]